MKNKEIELLKKLDRLFQPSYSQGYRIKQVTEILKSYSRDNTIEFLNWMCKKRFIASISGNDFFQCFTDENVYYTIEQLYELFLKDLNK